MRRYSIHTKDALQPFLSVRGIRFLSKYGEDKVTYAAFDDERRDTLLLTTVFLLTSSHLCFLLMKSR